LGSIDAGGRPQGSRKSITSKRSRHSILQIDAASKSGKSVGFQIDGIAAEAQLVRHLERRMQEHTDGDGAVDRGLQAKLNAIKQQRHMIQLNFQK